MMRVTDPIGGVPNLALYFSNYETYFQGLEHYSYHLQRLIAGYSRGDGVDELRRTFSIVVKSVAATQKDSTEKFGPSALVFAHKGKYAEIYRNGLVTLCFALCLRAGEQEVATLLQSCERGDPLLEAIVAVAAPEQKHPSAAPVFYPYFDLLYDALSTPEVEREACIAQYLEVWYRDRMKDFSFRDLHLEPDNSAYVGYWCFEAAGLVAALAIDDRTFHDHPHYPKDLVAFYRQR